MGIATFGTLRSVLYERLSLPFIRGSIVEPLNNGNSGTSCFVPCIEVVPFSEVKKKSTIPREGT